MYSKRLHSIAACVIFAGCTPNSPPEIDVATSSINELISYIDTNCQGDFRQHVRCQNAIEAKRKKTIKAMREAPGSFATIRSEKEIFDPN